MTQNPSDQDYPDGVFPVITFTARLVNRDTWEVMCPEWNCCLHTRNLTKTTAQLISEIEAHNEEAKTGEPGWNSPDFDFNKWAEENGFTRLRREQWPKPAMSLNGKSWGE